MIEQDEPRAPKDEDATETPADQPQGAERKLSRAERLKAKIRRLQGKDPDIYPMW